VKRLPRDVELQRLDAYTKTSDDDGAAQALGIRKVTFVAWRNREHLPCKRPPGQRKHITFEQERLLEYLAANPWSKLYAISKALEVHSWTVMERFHRLEGKGLVQTCIIGRVRHYALKDAEVPRGAQSLDAGAPGFYHTNLRGRIEELLDKEPWLPMCLIQKRLRAYGAPKSVEAALLSMPICGRLQRQVIETPKRRMYVYAAPGRRLSKTRQRKMWKEIGSTTSFWKTNDKVLKALRLSPWQTAAGLSKAEDIDRSYIYNALNSLMKRGLIRRVRVKLEHVGRTRPADYVYGLARQRDPRRLPVVREAELHRAALQRSAERLRALGYRVDLDLHPPEREKVLSVVHVEDVDTLSDAERFLEVVAK